MLLVPIDQEGAQPDITCKPLANLSRAEIGSITMAVGRALPDYPPPGAEVLSTPPPGAEAVANEENSLSTYRLEADTTESAFALDLAKRQRD